ncbi:MAG: hypothetical protein WED86_01125 [Chloroflexota bacterium]
MTWTRLGQVAALPLHPLMAAAYPVAFLYAQNVHEAIAPFELLVPLGLSLGLTVGALALFRALTRSWPTAALISTLLVTLFFTYGLAWDWLGSLLAGPWVLLVAWIVLAIIGVVIAWRMSGVARRLTVPLNAVGAFLLGINLLIIASFALNLRPAVANAGPGLTMSPAPAPGTHLPDIYWVILDRYGSANVLDKYFDYDNSPFLDELRARGFYIAEHATANYLKTALSMDSSRNMDYLDFAALREEASADDHWGPLYADLSAPFQVEHYLGSAGYRFIHLGTYWGPTKQHPSADINYVYDKLTSEFLDVLGRATLLRAFEGLGPEAPYDWRRNRWNQTRYELASLNRASTLSGPKFVLAHFALPHDPYVFHEDGSFVSAEDEAERARIVNYVDQTRFANAQMLAWLDSLLDGPEDERPIVIIQADEGPFPVRYARNERGFDWTTAIPEELEHKFGILSAFYVPGKSPEEAGLYDSITPVNQFRAIFHAYFGLDLPLLPDRNWIFVDQAHLYTEVDVTEKVRR